MNAFNHTTERAHTWMLAGMLLAGMILQTAHAQFGVTYYDNYDYSTMSWDYWELGDLHRFWNPEYLADFTSGATEPSSHYLSSVDVGDLRTGFGSLDVHSTGDAFTDDDWTPLKSIGDPAWYGIVSPHHVYAAKFEGMVYFAEGDVLSLESDDDSYIFLDDDTAWGEEVLSLPGMHPFQTSVPPLTITADLAGFHKMTVKFADTHEVQCGIRITLNGAPLQAALNAVIRIEPETLKLGSKGVLTVFISLPGGYSVDEIDVGTVECAGAPAVWAVSARDALIVKFNRQDLEGIVPGDEVTLAVTGALASGRRFFGIDMIRVNE